MIEAFFLEGEQVKNAELSAVKRTGMVWVRCLKPTEEEIAEIVKTTRLPQEEIKEYLDEDERPRVEEDNFLEVIYRAPHYDGDEINSIPFAVFIKGFFIVTLEKEPVKSLQTMANSMKKGRLKFLFKRSSGHFLFYILDKLDDEFLHVINDIAARSEIIQERGLRITKKNVETLYSLNTTLIHFNQAILANIEVVQSLRKDYHKAITKPDKELFAELYFDTRQLLDTEKIQREIVSSMFNFQSTLTNYELNIVIKKMTSIAFLVMIPTLIASIYGMNFKHIPLADSVWGFWMVNLVMLLFMGIGLWYLIKSDWL